MTNRNRVVNAVIAVTAAALLLTGCASDVTVYGKVPGPIVTTQAAAGAPVLAPGITVKGVVNNGRGTYLQTSIADDNPAMRYMPELADDAVKQAFTPDQIVAAQQVVLKFVAEEAIDSTLNGGGDAEGWWASHQDLFHPAAQASIHEDLLKGKDVVLRESWQSKYDGKYDYAYGANQTRIVKRIIKPFSIQPVSAHGVSGLRFSVDVAVTMAVRPKVGTLGNGRQHTIGPMVYDVALDGGKWKIAGYNNGARTSEG